jgi:hypothetical protein
MSMFGVGERLAAGGVVGGVALPIPSTRGEDGRHAAVTVNVLWGAWRTSSAAEARPGVA